MANTVPNLSYANTFGEWVTATSALIGENNRLAASDYTKDSGTLYLNETTQNSLQANGSVIIQKQLNVQGTGSSASIQNNLGVGGLLTLSNATYSLSAAGQANIGGPVYASGSGTGLTVANNVVIGKNTDIGGNTTITYNTITDTIQSNTSVNTTTLTVTGDTYTKTLQSNSSVNTSNASIVNTVYTKYLQANNTVNTANASIAGTTYTKHLQANTTANTENLSVTQTGYLNVVQANTVVNTQTISVTQTGFVNLLQSNSGVNTQTLSVTQGSFVNTLQANTSANTENLSVTQTARVRTLQANTSANTQTLSVTQTGFLDTVQANTTINTTNMWATTNVTANVLVANNYIRTPDVYSVNVSATGAFGGSGAVLRANTGQIDGSFSVGGNFTINGTTVYNTNQFVLSALTPNQTSYFGVYRATSNSFIRWNESSKLWELNDVDNTDAATTYSRILTANSITNSSTSTSTSTIPTSNLLTISYSKANSAASFANGAFDRANGAYTTANAAIANTNGVRTAGSMTIGGSLTVVADASIAGNLTVSGTTTYANTQQLLVGDNIITLNADLPANLAPTENAGVEINRGNQTNTYIRWDETAKWWVARDNVGEYRIANTTTYLTEGTNLYFTSARVRANVGNTTPILYDSSTGTFSFADSGATGGTYGSNTVIPVLTVNAKGIVTAISNTTATLETITSSLNANSTTKVISITNTSASTGTTSGALKISGGLGVAGNVYANAVYDNGSRAVTMVATNAASPLSSTNYAPGAFSISHDNSGVTASTHGSASAVPVFTVNATGHVTGVTNTSIAIASGAVSGLATSATTDTTNADNISSGTLNANRLATSGVTAATHGSSIQIPVFTVDNKGRVTSVSNTAIREATSQVTGVVRLENTYVSTSTSTVPTSSAIYDLYTIVDGLDTRTKTTANFRVNSLGVGTAASATAGEIRATDNITAYYSDERLKTKLGNIEDALEKVMSLSGFYYEANELAQSLGYKVKKEVGVSAQEVQAVLPEVVVPAPIDENYLTVRYEKIIPLLIEAIKELKAEVDQLKGK